MSVGVPCSLSTSSWWEPRVNVRAWVTLDPGASWTFRFRFWLFHSVTRLVAVDIFTELYP